MKHIFIAVFVLLFMSTFACLLLTSAGLAELKAAASKNRHAGRLPRL